MTHYKMHLCLSVNAQTDLRCEMDNGIILIVALASIGAYDNEKVGPRWNGLHHSHCSEGFNHRMMIFKKKVITFIFSNGDFYCVKLVEKYRQFASLKCTIYLSCEQKVHQHFGRKISWSAVHSLSVPNLNKQASLKAGGGASEDWRQLA